MRVLFAKLPVPFDLTAGDFSHKLVNLHLLFSSHELAAQAHPAMATPQISRKALASLLLLVAAAAAVSTASADDVLALTESTFEKEVGQDRAALVEFYAPW